MAQHPALLTASEVGHLLNVSAETVRRWARENRLPSVVLPSGGIRFRRAEIDALTGDDKATA